MGARLPEPEPWVALNLVLAEATGASDPGAFDVQAEAHAARMRGIRRDWAGRPTITWSAAEELLSSLRAEQRRVLADIEERAVAQDRAFRASLPAGLAAGDVPTGVSAGLLMMLRDPERQGSRRRSVVEDALARAGTVFTPIRQEQAGQ